MESTKDAKLVGLQSTFSRRNLLKGATAVTAAASVVVRKTAIGSGRTCSRTVRTSQVVGRRSICGAQGGCESHP